jgi:hypothetical protein
MNRAALLTLALGEKHLNYWRTHCEASWQAYTRTHGYDLIVVTQPLDASTLAPSRPPAWQKCLALSQPVAADYRQIALLDCDIIINPAAPPITDQVSENHIGGVIAGSHLHPDHRALLVSQLRGQQFPYSESAQRLHEHQAAYYIHHGLTPLDAGIVQTGVLIASPHHHRQLFESVYHAPAAINHRTFEQIPLSHAILSSGLFRPIDTRFNSVFYETMRIHYPYLNDTNTPSYELLASAAVQAAFFNSFFLHFAYIPHFAAFVPPLKQERDSSHAPSPSGRGPG